jgi:hypothetical protein
MGGRSSGMIGSSGGFAATTGRSESQSAEAARAADAAQRDRDIRDAPTREASYGNNDVTGLSGADLARAKKNRAVRSDLGDASTSVAAKSLLGA